MERFYETREEWLFAAGEGMRDMFAEAGYELPEKIRYAVAFSSKGAKGKHIGEHWRPEASEDGFHNIIIRADIANVPDVLAIIAHELVHAVMPMGEGHGKRFSACARAIGLEGKMTATNAGPILTERLAGLADALGEFPHGKLDFAVTEIKKQNTRMLKAECTCCGYTIRLTKKWAEVGLPDCPVDRIPLHCAGIGEDDDGEGE